MDDDTKNQHFQYLEFKNSLAKNRELYVSDSVLGNLKQMSVDDNYIFQIISDETQIQLRQFQERIQLTLKSHAIMFDLLTKIHQIIDFNNILTDQNSFQEGSMKLTESIKVGIHC